MFTKSVHKQNATGRHDFFEEQYNRESNLLYEAFNGLTEYKVLLLLAFEKYQPFLLGGPWSAISDLAFQKVEKWPLFY